MFETMVFKGVGESSWVDSWRDDRDVGLHELLTAGTVRMPQTSGRELGAGDVRMIRTTQAAPWARAWGSR